MLRGSNVYRPLNKNFPHLLSKVPRSLPKFFFKETQECVKRTRAFNLVLPFFPFQFVLRKELIWSGNKQLLPWVPEVQLPITICSIGRSGLANQVRLNYNVWKAVWDPRGFPHTSSTIMKHLFCRYSLIQVDYCSRFVKLLWNEKFLNCT